MDTVINSAPKTLPLLTELLRVIAFTKSTLLFVKNVFKIISQLYQQAFFSYIFDKTNRLLTGLWFSFISSLPYSRTGANIVDSPYVELEIERVWDRDKFVSKFQDNWVIKKRLNGCVMENAWRLLIIFSKNFILDVWQSSECAYDIDLFSMVDLPFASKRPSQPTTIILSSSFLLVLSRSSLFQLVPARSSWLHHVPDRFRCFQFVPARSSF